MMIRHILRMKPVVCIHHTFVQSCGRYTSSSNVETSASINGRLAEVDNLSTANLRRAGMLELSIRDEASRIPTSSYRLHNAARRRGKIPRVESIVICNILLMVHR